MFAINSIQDVTLSTQNSSAGSSSRTDDQDVRVRKYGEVVFNTLTSVASVFEYPKGELVCGMGRSFWLWGVFKRNFLIVDYIKESARPSYWVPDCEAPTCWVCKELFGTAEELVAAANGISISSLSSSSTSATATPEVRNSPQRQMNDASLCDRRRHHCRDCGQAVCENCSLGRRPVLERGWTTPVRVCDICKKKCKSDWDLLRAHTNQRVLLKEDLTWIYHFKFLFCHFFQSKQQNSQTNAIFIIESKRSLAMNSLVVVWRKPRACDDGRVADGSSDVILLGTS